MNSFSNNIYYHPEKLGFTMIGQLEDTGACYSFDTIIVVQNNETGHLFAAHDAGCSCPSPFEDINGVEDMQPIRTSHDLSVYIAMNDSTYSEKWPLKDRLELFRKIDKIEREKRQAENAEKRRRADTINRTNTPLVVWVDEQPLGAGFIR